MKILLFANTDWYLYNFRRSLAQALREAGHEVLLVSPPGAYVALLQDLGFRWVAAPMQRHSLNPLRELAVVAVAAPAHSTPTTGSGGTLLHLQVRGLRSVGRAQRRARAGLAMYSPATILARGLRPLIRSLLKRELEGAVTA
jgi:nucleoside-diphosphate-sugar epimerase